jgi:hypothetical protein
MCRMSTQHTFSPPTPIVRPSQLYDDNAPGIQKHREILHVRKAYADYALARHRSRPSGLFASPGAALGQEVIPADKHKE